MHNLLRLEEMILRLEIMLAAGDPDSSMVSQMLKTYPEAGPEHHARIDKLLKKYPSPNIKGGAHETVAR